MTTPIDRAFASILLTAASKSGDPGTIRLAAILAGAAPCETCGYIHDMCRCEGFVKPKRHSLGSFLRSILEQGSAIERDRQAGAYLNYEQYSARMDEAARDRVEQFLREKIK